MGRGAASAARPRALRLAVALCAAAACVLVLRDAGAALVVSVPVDNPDAIVSLASHEWERLPAAAALARRYPRARLFLTQPAIVTQYNCHDCAGRSRYLAAMGVDPARIDILPLRESSTYGEALAVRDAMHRDGARRLAIVTSPYHTRRAFDVFEKVLRADGDVIGVVPATPYSPAAPARWWRSPYDRWYVTYEWCAIAAYMARGRLPWALL